MRLALIFLDKEELPLSPDLVTIARTTTTKSGFLRLHLANKAGTILLHGAIAQAASECLVIADEKPHGN